MTRLPKSLLSFDCCQHKPLDYEAHPLFTSSLEDCTSKISSNFGKKIECREMRENGIHTNTSRKWGKKENRDRETEKKQWNFTDDDKKKSFLSLNSLFYSCLTLDQAKKNNQFVKISSSYCNNHFHYTNFLHQSSPSNSQTKMSFDLSKQQENAFGNLL